jgi:hypothetical protein
MLIALSETGLVTIRCKLLHLRDKAESPPGFSPQKTAVFHHLLCVDIVHCPVAGNCYKSGKISWLLNLYWWKKR